MIMVCTDQNDTDGDNSEEMLACLLLMPTDDEFLSLTFLQGNTTIQNMEYGTH